MPRRNRNARKRGLKRGRKGKGRSQNHAPLSPLELHPRKRPGGGR